MFLIGRASPQAIERFLLRSQKLPPSYGPVGMVRTATVRHDVDEEVVVIGRGEADFERASFGFANGTLTNHAEGGEELFEVFMDSKTNEVKYRIRTLSCPQAMLTRLRQPLVRMLQARFRRDSAEAMKRATHAEGVRQ